MRKSALLFSDLWLILIGSQQRFAASDRYFGPNS